MALPPEKISELKQIIHNQLSQGDVQRRIREMLAESMQEEFEGSKNPMGEQEMFNRLKQRGVVDNILQQIQFEGSTSKPATHMRGEHMLENIADRKTNIDPTRRYLYLYIKSGKAFLEHIDDDSGTPGQVTSYFTFHILFRGQRFKSRPVACACEPDIDEGFLLELHKDGAGEAGKMADPTTMLSICDPIHIVLVKTDGLGETTLVSSHFLEWRPVLTNSSSRLATALELKGTGSENNVAAGVIDIQVELFPKTKQSLSKDVITAQIQLERSRHAEQERLFLVYAKQWWKEYLLIREVHKERLVKIFAQDENGNNRPVCSFVKPLRAGRLLHSAREAARFVSLIHQERTPTLGGGARTEQWTTMHAFLARNKGDCEDHAVLLCSLLLGFGLDAYVCVGTQKKSAPHAWVMTVSIDGLVTFWESLNGHRYIHEPLDPYALPMDKRHRPKYPYKTVGCVYNHQSFYANNQPTDNIEVCQFNLRDDARWKSMSHDAIMSVCGSGASPVWPQFPPLSASTIDPALASNDLEQQLRVLVMEHRRDMGLTTVWDDQLSYLLSPSLASYEIERTIGLTPGNEEFSDSINQAVPDGHTFKGYPAQFTHRNARKIFATCLRHKDCEPIIHCRGDHVRMAVRVLVRPYPESTCATWIMFACKYKCIV
ncbi:centrosomal protein of 76 kDa-like [Dreissena polymorpha]|uniref:centrosomal protein of 76 kDa-like n=1 Tax=Dreissena polymorpha TaxID=45954 RepID=UPI0022644939|nr:centrosomal protein of 76 kDa-like [Dreissena polymorpha]